MPFRMILAILFLVIAVPLLVAGKRQVEGEEVNFRKLGLIPVGLFVLLTLLACVRIVGPGKVGIPVTFGSAGAPLNSGVAFTNPFASVNTLSVRTEEYTMSKNSDEGSKKGDDSVEVLGSDGATGRVDATIVFRLERGQASRMFREVGTNYISTIVRPTSRSCIRDAFVGYSMVDGATNERSLVAKDIEDCIDGVFGPRGLVLEDFQLRDVTLSEAVRVAIDSKVEAEQRSEQQRFELARAEQEAEIARVEAQGRADAQQIIACGGRVITEGDVTKVVPNTGEACQNTLSPAYLQYLYIQSLQSIANSPNNSTVILPFDQNLTPLLNMPMSQGSK